MVESVAILLVVLAGAQLALQAPVNNRLGDTVGRLGAALVSNTVGSLILTGILLAVLALGIAGGSEGPAGILHVPPWQLLGGVSGGLWVALSVVAVGRIGVGTVTAATITGQLTSALVIDQFGWLGLAQRSATPLRVGGVALLIAGTVMVAGRPSRNGANRTGAVHPERHLDLVLAIFLIGLTMGFQHPLNARLAETVGDVGSALTNFVIGILIMLPWLAATGGFAPFRRFERPRPLYLLGGLFGVIVVLNSIIWVKVIGATVLFTAQVTGQLFGSVVLDRIGAFGLSRRPLDPKRAAGLVLLLAGTVAAVI